MGRLSLLTAITLTAALTACGGDADDHDGADTDAPATAAAPARAVTIREPTDGSTVDGPDVRVVLEARGFTVTTAGDTTADSGHHHVFLDRDVSAPGSPIPAEEGFIIHMGDGSAERVLQGVSAGQHRLITVVGDAFHVPLRPMLSDTVTFTVRGGSGGD